jgi:hypothetical protein
MTRWASRSNGISSPALQWSQVELATGRLHVHRAKNGSPSVHPMQGDGGRMDYIGHG